MLNDGMEAEIFKNMVAIGTADGAANSALPGNQNRSATRNFEVDRISEF